MKVRVKLFAAAREKTGQNSVELTLGSSATIQDLLETLQSVYPELQVVSGRWAVNLDFVGMDHAVQLGDEVAFIPPTCGG